MVLGKLGSSSGSFFFIFFFLGVESRTLHLSEMYFTSELHSNPKSELMMQNPKKQNKEIQSVQLPSRQLRNWGANWADKRTVFYGFKKQTSSKLIGLFSCRVLLKHHTKKNIHVSITCCVDTALFLKRIYFFLKGWLSPYWKLTHCYKDNKKGQIIATKSWAILNCCSRHRGLEDKQSLVTLEKWTAALPLLKLLGEKHGMLQSQWVRNTQLLSHSTEPGVFLTWLSLLNVA